MDAEVKEKKKKYEDYEIEEAVRTLMRAEEIKADPALMKCCMKEVSKKKKAISSIAQLKKMANDPEDMDD